LEPTQELHFPSIDVYVLIPDILEEEAEDELNEAGAGEQVSML
jgi:hypothetical protein